MGEGGKVMIGGYHTLNVFFYPSFRSSCYVGVGKVMAFEKGWGLLPTGLPRLVCGGALHSSLTPHSVFSGCRLQAKSHHLPTTWLERPKVPGFGGFGWLVCGHGTIRA